MKRCRFQGYIAKCTATFTCPYKKVSLEKVYLFQRLSAQDIAVIQEKQKTKNSCP